MAARTREREQKRGEAEIQPVEQKLVEHDWLNGWPRISATQVMIGAGVHCVACGRCQGVTCVVFDPDCEWPDQRPPVWPFTEQDCPISGCRDWSPGYAVRHQ